MPPAALISATTSSRGAGRGARAIEVATEVGDDDARALLGHQQRDAAADASARAGDERDAPTKSVTHG